MSSKGIKFKNTVARLAGYLALFLCFLFIGFRLWENRSDFSGIHFHLSLIGALVVSSITYALASLLIAVAWQRLLTLLGEKKASFKTCFPVYAHSQIAKYIPGNIVHIAGRHAMGRTTGLSNASLVAAALYEMIGLVTCAGLIKISINFSSLTVFDPPVSITIFVVVILILSPISFMMIKSRLMPPQSQVKSSSIQVLSGILGVTILYTLFFLLAGISLLGLVYGIHITVDITKAFQMLSIFSVSWLAGFLTPGAPAGIGVREAVMIALMEGIIGKSNSVIISILFRLVTIAGDVILFFMPFFLFRHQNKESHSLPK